MTQYLGITLLILGALMGGTAFERLLDAPGLVQTLLALLLIAIAALVMALGWVLVTAKEEPMR